MDTFTATIDPTQPQPQMQMDKKPIRKFRLLFLFLLLAVLASASATTYILLSKVNQPPVEIVKTIEPNPFDDETAENPLDDTTQTASAEGLFSETETTNFFDQFGDDSASPSTTGNPF